MGQHHRKSTKYPSFPVHVPLVHAQDICTINSIITRNLFNHFQATGTRIKTNILRTTTKQKKDYLSANHQKNK